MSVTQFDGQSAAVPELESELVPFTPNSHSKFKIEWNSVNNQESDKLLEIFGRYYDCGQAASIEHVGEWEKMSNNYKVKLADGNYVLLRRHIQLREQVQINFLNSILSHLSAKGVKVPVVISTKYGQNEILVDSNHYQVFSFIAGDHFRGDEIELKDVAVNIASLHKILAEMPVSHDEEMWKQPLLPAWNREGWKNIFEKVNFLEDDVSKTCHHYRELIEFWLAKVECGHKDISSLSLQPIHADLHPQNTIFSNRKLVAMLDFESVRVDSVIRDFGNAMHRFVRQYVVNSSGSWRTTLPVGLKIFFDAYSTINPLDKRECKFVSVLIADELLRKLFKDITLYFQGYQGNIDKRELIKKLNLLNEVSLIQTYFNP